MEYKNPGANLDTRPQEEVEQDFLFEEVVASAAPVQWIEKSQKDWRKFPIFDQDGSGSCVAQTLKKMLGVYIWLKTKVWVSLSASHIYKRRSNAPSSGMIANDAFQIAQKGVTLEEFAPSERMNDTGMDNVKIVPFMERIGEVFKIGNYLGVKTGDIDLIASIIQETGKAVMVWFYFSDGLRPREWTDVPETKHNIGIVGPSTARHSVAAVDFTLYKGKKALIIEDSWGMDTAMNGQRVITEDFFKERNFYAAHFMNFAFEEGRIEEYLNKLSYRFETDLEYTKDYVIQEDAKILQDILKYEGVFPTNVESTGYYGMITKKAVGLFQEKHGIVQPGGAGYGRVGPKTRAKLNEIYN